MSDWRSNEIQFGDFKEEEDDDEDETVTGNQTQELIGNDAEEEIQMDEEALHKLVSCILEL